MNNGGDILDFWKSKRGWKDIVVGIVKVVMDVKKSNDRRRFLVVLKIRNSNC